MLSYQHSFHAGNHADILKHYVLTFVLNSLNKKEKPYTFFDTHSGSGIYDLLDNRSLKTGEASKGIIALSEFYNNLNSDLLTCESFSSYFDLISDFLKVNKYPGSPKIEELLIRNQDSLILSELHPLEIENLRKNLGVSHKNVKIHYRNGFEMLKALTPPVTKRGAVLIDPSYEEKKDYDDVAQTVIYVNKKWSNGIIMVWYPLLAHRKNEIDLMVSKIQNAARDVNPNTEIVNLTLCVDSIDSHKEMELSKVLADEDKKNPPRLYGSGMLVINAPWHLLEEGQKVTDFLTSFYQKKTQ